MPAPLHTAIDLRHLRYFLAVIEELHFGRAAEKMHMSQPPLSQAIRRLEEQLGVRLLDRNSRTVRSTEAGRVLAAEARKVLASFDVAVAEARRAGGGTSALQIGCIQHLPVERLQQLLGPIRDLCPQSTLEVTHLVTVEQIARLGSGELDFGMFTYAEDHAGIVTEPLFPGEALAAHLPREHALAGKAVIGPADLEGENLVLFPRWVNPALHDRVLALTYSAGYRFAGVRETGGATPRDVTLAVAGGFGVALEPVSFTEVAQAGTLVSRRALDPPVSMPDTVLAWRANPPRHLRPVIETVRAVARELRQKNQWGGNPQS
jgi:DNA-binding transcriptional LysR family regulator